MLGRAGRTGIKALRAGLRSAPLRYAGPARWAKKKLASWRRCLQAYGP
jgi:hypothetical protein